MSHVTVLDFYAEWCQPCKQISKILPHFEKSIAGIGSVEKVNIEEQADLTESFGIRSVPTFVLMQNGIEVDRVVGVIPLAQLEERVKKIAYREI
jgi:thioredoxin 1